MRKLLSDKKIVFGVIVLIYIMSQILGTLAIKSFFLNYKKNELTPFIKHLANEIESGNRNLPKNNDFILVACDVNGQEIDIFTEDYDGIGVEDPTLSKNLAVYLPSVLDGNRLAVIDKVDDRKYETIVLGYPIVIENKVSGAVFLMKPASDYKAVLNGFYLVFFVTLFIGLILIVVFLKSYYNEMLYLEQTKRNYITNVSHELKSPISSIKALAETLQDDIVKDEETKAKYYSIIIRESNNLQKLVTDMLELCKIQNRQANFEKQHISGKELMQEVFDQYSVIIKDIGIDFEITKTAFELPVLYTNKDRILQVINIMIDNALKFTNENGKIVVDAKNYDNYIMLIISDNGVGIEKGKIPYIFDRFYKDETIHNANGSGLGLSIAKEIIEGLNERVWVESMHGKGTSFSFTVSKG